MTERITVSWGVENGHPHYKVHDKLTNQTVHCDENELNETIWEFTYHVGNKEVYDGIVLWVNEEQRIVMVSYLEGYKDRSDAVPFEDMIAAYDENGEMMNFSSIKGKSVLLTVE